MQLAGLDQTSFGAAFLMGMKYASVSDPFLNSLVHVFYKHFLYISTFILSLVRALHPVNFLFLSDALTTVLLFDHFNNLYLTFIFLEATMFPASCYILILTFEYN